MHNNTRSHLYTLTNNVNINKDYKDNNKEYVYNAQPNIKAPRTRSETRKVLPISIYTQAP